MKSFKVISVLLLIVLILSLLALVCQGKPMTGAFPDNLVSAELISSRKGKGASNQTIFLLEGDIAVPAHRSSSSQLKNSTLPARYAVNSNWQLWAKARIPYVIDRSLSWDSGKIRQAMKHIEDKTCVVFTPRRGERDYVRIYRGPNRSCYSMIGKTGGSQSLSLGDGCLHHGVIVHELMHAIGFYHMHSRSDRDNYLTVLWGNIQSGRKVEFNRNSPNMNKILGPFDYESIMLYGAKLFSRNGRDTMIARKRGVVLRDTAAKWGLSKMDMYNINSLYGCNGKKSEVPSVTSNSGPSTRRPNFSRRRGRSG